MMIDWDSIHWVLLDMDGTLLDLHFDNYFWLQHMPGKYAAHHSVSLEQAHASLGSLYQSNMGCLNWYCLDFWTETLGMDVAAFKHEVDHLIQVRPCVVDFLDAVRASGRPAVMVTNAHLKSLQLKMDRTRLDHHLDRMISSHSIGLAKEEAGFWERLSELEPFDPQRTLLVDDSLAVLDAARDFGIKHLLAVHRPDSQQAAKDVGDYQGIDSFRQIMPIGYICNSH
jgi:putative hydrolase of the HAD superfamily